MRGISVWILRGEYSWLESGEGCCIAVDFDDCDDHDEGLEEGIGESDDGKCHMIEI